MKHTPLVVMVLTSALSACSSSDGRDDTTQQTNQTGQPTPQGCGVKSGFDGDELCLVPPAAGEGIQIHVGPPSYDADAVAPYVIQAGDENVMCYLVRIPEAGFYYLRQENHMRSGSHHMLIGIVPDEGQPEGPAMCDSLGMRLGSIPGSQTPTRTFPSELGPEDAGLARYLPEGGMALFQLHYVNTDTKPKLREAWVNLYRLDESQVSQRLQSVFLVADIGVSIEPHTRELVTNTFTPSLTESTRLFGLNAHMHAHSLSMTVWRVHAGEDQLVYKSYDWAEPRELTYNSVVQNPPPDDATLTDGGHSGLLFMEPGDSLRWTCDVDNTLDTALHFANEAYTAEMCLLAGAYVSDTAGLFAGGCSGGACFNRLP